MEKALLESIHSSKVFRFYSLGGSGQRYTPENVALMRKIPIHLLGPFDDAVNKYDDSPIILATLHNDYEFMKFLLENNANPKRKRYDGKTAFDYADEKGKQILHEFCEAM